jgi:hypothetical protein
MSNGPAPPRKRFPRARLPLVSGKTSAFVLVFCLVLAGGLVLLLAQTFHLPLWIGWELVLAAWWLLWVVTLTRFLYRGLRISDDHRMGAPRKWFAGWFKGGASPNIGDIGFVGDGCGEGCMVAVGVFLAVIVAVIGFWFLIEVAIPALAFVLYFLIRGMLARVANDFHGCTGNLPRSLRWGAAWATLYTAPLALLVLAGHLIRQQV